MPLMRVFSIMMLSLWLTACGGGGSIEKNDNSGDGDTSEYLFTLSGKSSKTKEESNWVSVDAPLDVTAVLTKEGIIQTDVRVTFTTDQFATMTPSSGTVLTDHNGAAVITLAPTAIEGAGRVTVSFVAADETVTGFFDFNSSGGGGTDSGVSGDVTLTVSVVDKANLPFTESNPVTQDNPGFIRATLQKDGNALARQIVSFSTEFTGEIKNGTERAITDEQGLAVLELGSGQSKGAGRVTVTYQDTSTNESISKSDVFFSSGDTNLEDDTKFLLDVKLLTGCNANWDANRDEVLIDPLNTASGCQVVNSISSNDLADIYIRLTSAPTGDGVAVGLVNVETGLGTTLPSSGNALTDNFGVALLKLQPGNEGGAGTLKVTSAQADNVESTINFSVGIADLELSINNGLPIENGNVVSLNAGGSTVISVTLRDESGSLYNIPTDVEFSSTCATAGQATLDAMVKSANGIASSTYRAVGCQGNDDVTVNVQTGGKNFNIRTVIPVLSAPVQAIKFESVTEQFIALPPGEGGIPTQSIVKFTLLDEDSLAVPRARVDFKLSDNQGLATLTQRTSNTNTEGSVQTTVKSGIVPGPLVVRACYIQQADLDILAVSAPTDDYSCWAEDVELCKNTPADAICPTGTLHLYPLSKQVYSVSSQIILSSGVTDQNTFDASADILNSNSLNHNNVISNITVFFGDQFNQFNADGVTATVLAEQGAIGSIDGTNTFQCITDNASCTVQWRSQGDRPFTDAKWGNRIGATNPKTGEINCDLYFGTAAPCWTRILRAKNDPNGVVMGGRVSILAVAKGQENFRDEESDDPLEVDDPVVRRNGLFDIGEYRQEFDLSEAFLDTNENSVFDKENCSRNGTGLCTPTTTVNGGHDDDWRDLNNNGVFDFADDKYNGLLCSEAAQAANECTRDLIEVRDNLELVMSGDVPYVRFSIPKTASGVEPYLIHVPANCQSVPFDPTSTRSGLVKATIENSDNSGFCDVNTIDLSTSTIDDPNSADPDVTVDEGVTGFVVYIHYSDVFGNPLPAGTEVTITATNGELSLNSHQETIPNTNSDRTMFSVVTLTRELEGNKKFDGALSIEFLIKNGDTETKITRGISITDDR
ncbi:hypothetical protein [Pseudoalteromonas sp. MMG005]|uniref:hypothetical protein n=1 Tax=Pseudoalteromonas sp. MMG005 TaxID=2822682 RepID=UPI001B39FE7F|nr:hypothetical protein [Pseudoalteromonas sp. MMG005]MBQ4846940.1 hypothetical protein [Pseudoalteromonas sp. MMG005]